MLATCRRALCTGRATCLASLRTGSGSDRVPPKTVFHSIGFSSGLHASATEALPPSLGRPAPNGDVDGSWSEEECSRLLEMRKANHSWKAMLEYFPGRTPQGLTMKYYRLQAGLQHAKSRKERIPWTPEELKRRNALRAQGLSWPQISQQMPGRSMYAVKYAHRRPLKPRRHTARRWTAAEVENLQGLVEDFGFDWEEIARRMPGRTVAALVAKHWSLAEPTNKSRFTEAESRLISDLKLLGLNWAEIAEKLPGKTKDIIRSHHDAKRYSTISPDRVFGHKWTVTEDAKLVQMRTQGRPWKEIAETLGVSCAAGNLRLRRMKRDDLINNKNNPFQPRKWSAEEDLRLRTMREQGLTWKKIAEELGGSQAAVCKRYQSIVGREQSGANPS
ncbi:hypothetical protein EJ03DRAFT_15354 [Teratosphaeria nubilosa]|uniref:Myb-like domain-containing protein n=1 Tax=Teratosphaeria nubilosa TaxID=161662 RepID=A0A6G1KXC8_9PEZI|nr:hypothetical protein EJ03DRAFT_15354 [Teratosphaeria nubilosa]